MKKILALAGMIVASVFISGCEKEMTVERMTSISKAAGITAGYVCELSKTKESVRTAILNVLDIVTKLTPAEDQSFIDCWTPVVNTEVDKLVVSGVLTQTEGELVNLGREISASSLDFVFKKLPEAKKSKELVIAAIKGFSTGFKSVVTKQPASNEIDTELESELRKSPKLKK